MLTPEAFAVAAQRFDFERWAGGNALGRGLFVRNYRIPLLRSGWELVRAWSVPATESSPPAMQTLWRNPAAGPEALLRVDVYECASRLAAHEQMLHLLGQNQMDNVTPVSEGEIGDVHATTTNGEMAVFARGNLVIFVARAGTQVMPATSVAEELDADIVEEPAELVQPAAEAAAVASVQRFTSRPTKAKKRRAVTVHKEAIEVTPGEPVMVKVFTDGGDPVLQDGRIELHATQAGVAKAVTYEIGAEGGPSRESILRAEER